MVGRINTGKLIAGGTGAGIVYNVLDYFVNNFLLATDWLNVAQARVVNLEEMGSMSALVTYVIVDFILAFLIVWTYTAIRPRLGPGKGTAAIAAFVIWIATSAVLLTLVPAFLPWRLFVRTQSLTLVVMLATGLTGGWIYSEDVL